VTRISIRSRYGNVTLGLAGFVIVVAALTTLGVFMSVTWHGSSLIEKLLQLALLGAAGGGAFLIRVALGNLGLPHRLLRGH
jgi:hypothetical protein